MPPSKGIGLILIYCFVIIAIFPACSFSNSDKKQPNKIDQKLRIYTSSTGVFEITKEDVNSLIPGEFSWKNVILYHRNHVVPYWLVGDGSEQKIRFYSGPPDSLYTAETIFILDLAPEHAPVQLEINHLSATTGGNFYTPLPYNYIEKNRIYEPLFPGEDPLFWERSLTGSPVIVPFDIDLGVSQFDQISLFLWPLNSTNENFKVDMENLNIDVRVNNQALREISRSVFSGQIQLDLIGSGDVLLPGQNQLEIKVVENSPGEIRVIYLDKVRVTLSTWTNNIQGDFFFEGQSGKAILPSDSYGWIIELDNSLPTRIVSVESDQVDHNTFPTRLERTYFYFTDETVSKPTKIKLVDTQNFGSQVNEAEYLILAPAEFVPALEPLLNHRQLQGLSTSIVPIELIWNQYGFGYPEPAALRDYLADAVQFWENPPRYVFLVGDYSHAVKLNTQNSSYTLLPPQLVYTEYGGWTLSDTDLVDFDRDGVPNIAVGRLPAKDISQVSDYVQKLLIHEEQQPLNQFGSYLLADPSESEFLRTAKNVETKLALEKNSSKNVPVIVNSPENFKLDQIWGAENLFYFGHGSLTQLSYPAFITSEMILANQTELFPTFFYLFTCLSGYFGHPDQPSIAENILFQTKNGGLIVFASTSLTLPNDQNLLIEAIVAKINKPYHRVGDLILDAQWSVMIDQPGILDVLRTYILFGDPGLKISQEH
jgi:hypothetical protein